MQISVLSPVNQRDLVGGCPKPEVHILGVVEQMLSKAATELHSLYMAIKLVVDDADLLPSPYADFRNVNRPVQSRCYPNELTLSRKHLLIRRGALGVLGCFFLDMIMYIVLALSSIEFQVITISPSTEIVDITLQMMIVSRGVDWAIKQEMSSA